MWTLLFLKKSFVQYIHQQRDNPVFPLPCKGLVKGLAKGFIPPQYSYFQRTFHCKTMAKKPPEKKLKGDKISLSFLSAESSLVFFLFSISVTADSQESQALIT
jgi:hypothetical protein